MYGFSKFVDSVDHSGTLIELCSTMLRVGFTADDTGFQIISDLLRELGNDLKADAVSYAVRRRGMMQVGNYMNNSLQRSNRQTVGATIVASGSKGFVSLDDGGLVGLKRRPSVSIGMRYEDVLNSGLMPDGVNKPRPEHIKSARIITHNFPLTIKAINTAIEHQMGVQQMYGEDLSLKDVNLRHKIDYIPRIDSGHLDPIDYPQSMEFYEELISRIPELFGRGIAEFAGKKFNRIVYNNDIEHLPFLETLVRKWSGNDNFWNPIKNRGVEDE